jgi:WD40 repeat protein
VKRELLGFIIIISGIFLISIGIVYPKEDVEIVIQTGHSGDVNSVAISPDGQTIVSASEDNTVRIWDEETGKEIRRSEGHTGNVYSVAISPDGQTIVSGSSDHTIRIWDKATGQTIQRLQGHTIGVNSVAISPDGQTIVSGSNDGIKIWDSKKGKLVATLIAFKDGEWVTYTPDNYYISSPKGDKYISFRVGNKLYSFEQYSEIYKKEDVVSRVLKGEDINKILTELQMEKFDITQIPAPVVVINYFEIGENLIKPENQTVNSSHINIAATVVEPKLGIGKVVIQLNDRTIAEKKGLNLKEYRIEQPVTLREKNNRIKITAYSTKDVKGYSREINLIYKEELLKGLSLRELVRYFFGKSRSWAVVIGINDYSKSKNGFKRLPYAVNDAKAVKKFLINSLGFSENKIFSLYNGEATKKRIEQLLAETLPKKVSEDDRIVIYFSGHGDQEQLRRGKKFGYLIPFDGNKNSLYPTCISVNQLQYFSEKNPAKQMLFILDSCFSGLAGVVKKGKIPKETRKQVEAFIKTEGRQIMTAGGADETTVMSKEWNNHSVYTLYLLKGLRGAADYNKDKVISIRELQVYLDSTVPKEAKQTPQLFNLNNSEGQFVFYREGDK